MNGISKLLSIDGYIQVNKVLIKKLGLHEAIILGELCTEYNYWENENKLENDMFYSTRENIEENTGLNEHYQRKAFATLKEHGIISVEKKGLPAVNYYKINFDKLLMTLSTSSSSREGLDVNLVNLNNNKEIKINKKTNSKELVQNFEFGKTKPKKESLYTKCVNMIDDFTNDVQIRKDLIEYLKLLLEMRNEGYVLYANTWKGLLRKLSELSDNDNSIQHDIIRQSIERGYKSFYPAIMSSSSLHNESGARHVPRMTAEDYAREAELEAKGELMKF